MSELHNQALTIKEQATGLQVVDATTYSAAGELLKALASMKKKIVEHYKPLKQAIDESKKKVLAQEKSDLGPVEKADEITRRNVTAYLDAEEKKRREAEAEAIRKAEAEAEKEREKLLTRAANAKTESKQEELLEKAEMVYVAPVTVEHSTDKTTNGVTRKTETVVTLMDLQSFVSALVTNGNPLTMIEVKPGPLKAWVKANDIKKFPGLLIEDKSTIAVRS